MSNGKILILPDVHLEVDTIPKPYQVVKKFIKDFKPDEIIILGDFFNCDSMSEFEGKKPTYEDELKTVKQELIYLKKYTKKLTYLEGNHEYRITRQITKDPNRLKGRELHKELNFKELGIKWVEMNKLYKKGHAYFTHGFWYNDHHAKKHLYRYGCCVVYGHSHIPQTYTMNMKMQEPIQAYGLGCLGDCQPDYLKGRPPNWLNQFAVMYLSKNGNFNLYPINIINNKFIWQGKEYK